MSISDPLLAKQVTLPDSTSRTSEPADDATTFEPYDVVLYERVAPELIRFATTLVGPSGAEDLFAVAVLKAFYSPGWSAVDNKRAYLYRCLVNEAHKQRRTTSRRLEREARVAQEVRTDAIDPDPTVLGALRKLRVRQRAVVYLTYWSDLTPQQVADTLDTSLRTVERDLTNARTQLEELLS